MLPSAWLATYRDFPPDPSARPLGPPLAPASIVAVRVSAPVDVLRVNDATVPAPKLLTNATDPAPAAPVAVAVGVSVGDPETTVVEELVADPVTRFGSPLVLHEIVVLIVAAIRITAGTIGTKYFNVRRFSRLFP